MLRRLPSLPTAIDSRRYSSSESISHSSVLPVTTAMYADRNARRKSLIQPPFRQTTRHPSVGLLVVAKEIILDLRLEVREFAVLHHVFRFHLHLLSQGKSFPYSMILYLGSCRPCTLLVE